MCNNVLRSDQPSAVVVVAPAAVPPPRDWQFSSSPKVSANTSSRSSIYNHNSAVPSVDVQFLLDQISGMRTKESTTYDYQNYLRVCIEDDTVVGPTSGPASSATAGHPSNANVTKISWFQPSWREQICEWCYSVVDHFDLSRETVALSLALFDRYLATLGNRCSGDLALLASLTTTHIAIKVLETKKIRLTTLCKLSRGMFGPTKIEDMEWTILTRLGFCIHPPTSSSFACHLADLLPALLSSSTTTSATNPSSSILNLRREIIDYSRYLSELSVCDLFFVEFYPSTIAYAAILNVLGTNVVVNSTMTHKSKEEFVKIISQATQLHPKSPDVIVARERLKMIVNNIGVASAGPAPVDNEQQQQYQQDQRRHHHPTSAAAANKGQGCYDIEQGQRSDIPRTCTYDESGPYDERAPLMQQDDDDVASDLSSCLDGNSIASDSSSDCSSCYSNYSGESCSSSSRKKFKAAPTMVAGSAAPHHHHHQRHHQSLARAVSPVTLSTSPSRRNHRAYYHAAGLPVKA